MRLLFQEFLNFLGNLYLSNRDLSIVIKQYFCRDLWCCRWQPLLKFGRFLLPGICRFCFDVSIWFHWSDIGCYLQWILSLGNVVIKNVSFCQLVTMSNTKHIGTKQITDVKWNLVRRNLPRQYWFICTYLFKMANPVVCGVNWSMRRGEAVNWRVMPSSGRRPVNSMVRANGNNSRLRAGRMNAPPT